MDPENTTAPLEEEDERRSPLAVQFDMPAREPSETPLNPEAEVETSVTQLEDLTNLRVAVMVFADVEEAEIVETTRALREAGAEVDVISPDGHEVQLMRHDEKTRRMPANASYDLASADDYDATLLPGGTINADNLRMQEKARDFVRALDAAGKPIAAICHAPWLLVSAGLVDDRTLTSYYTLQDDVRNAGGLWLDEEVVVDDNWVTSRSPRDIPAFNREMIRLFATCRAA